MRDIRQNYLNIQGWMVQDLNLKGNELLAFGLIFGFCQDDNSEFTGSVDYLSTWLNTSRPTTMKALSNLCTQNLIIKRIEIVNNVQFNRYKINLGVVKKLYGGSKETLRGGSKETLPNNTILDKTKDNDVVVPPEQKPEVPAFIQQQQQEFRDLIEKDSLNPKLNKKETLDILRTDLDLINQVLREFKKSNIKTDSFCLTNNDIYKCTENFKSWYEGMIEDCILKAHNKNEYPKKLGDTKMHVINFLRYQDFAKLKVQLTPKETVTNQVYDRQFD